MARFFRFPFGLSGDRTSIPDATQPGGEVSFNQGFGPDYEIAPGDPGWKPVPREETNSLYFDLTDNLRQYQLYGVPEWVDASQNGGVSVSYAIAARVRHNDIVYASLVATNVAEPGTDATKWAVDEPFTLSAYEASLAESLAGTIGTKIITPRRLASAVQRGVWNYAVAGGTANALTATLAPAIAALTAGTLLHLKVTANNTGVSTLNVNGLGATAIKTLIGGDVAGGDLPNGTVVDLIFDGANWLLLSVTATNVMNAYIAAGRPPQVAPYILAQGQAGVAQYPNNVASFSPDLQILANQFLDPATTFAGGILTVGPKDAGVWQFTANLGLNGNNSNWTSKVQITKNAGAVIFAYQETGVSGISGTGNISVSGAVNLAPGDAIGPRMTQNTGSQQGSSNLGNFTGVRVGV